MERGAGLPNPEHPIETGDAIIGLASNGIHSNGYSLVRKIIERSGLSLGDAVPFGTSGSLGTALLAPTRIYVSHCLDALKSVDFRAFAHITGGGLLENIPRVLPDGLGVKLDGTKWTAPPVFAWLQDQGEINDIEMARTFNCGIGMVGVVPADRVDEALATFAALGEKATHIGQVVVSPDSSVQIDNLQVAFGRG